MTENEGWVKLHRSFLNWEWWGDKNTTQLFLYLLIAVNWEDKRWQGKIIKRGSIVTSIPHLAVETGLSEQNVRTALKHLEETGEINRQTTNKYSLISVQNYDLYQADQQTTNRQLTDNQQATNRQLTTTKEVKNIRSKEINNKSSPPEMEVVDDQFDAFWKAYPKKVGKIAARKAWDKVKADPVLFNKIMESLEAAKRTDQWIKDNGQFIPHPTTWLNQGRWMDELKDKNSDIEEYISKEESIDDGT